MPVPSQSIPIGASKLLRIEPPKPPIDFASFWSNRYDQAMQVEPLPTIHHDANRRLIHFEQYDCYYHSTGGVRIGGWLTVPRSFAVRRAIVVAHGYGGCPEPTDDVPLKDAAYLWPCLRGLGRSEIPGIPTDPYFHVLYDIDKLDRYILGGCVEDLWLAVSALERLFPIVKNRVGMMGISFSGGIGMLAAPWDERLQRIHLQVPTFGHHALRMKLPSCGSAKALQDFYQSHAEVLDSLAYFDAANAAAYMNRPVHIAAALLDPVVAPEGQFAIYNALPREASLYVLDQGHSDYAHGDSQQKELLHELTSFFSAL